MIFKKILLEMSKSMLRIIKLVKMIKQKIKK
jgi:hypothetical protein